MNNLSIALFLLSTLLISGCKSTKADLSTSNTEHNQDSIQNLQNPEVNTSYPKWVFTPKLNGYHVVLGSAPKQINKNYRAQLTVAISSARAELAKIKNTSVASTLDIERTSDKPLSFESNTNIESNVAFDISKADVIKSWKHPETEELFILYGYKIK